MGIFFLNFTTYSLHVSVILFGLYAKSTVTIVERTNTRCSSGTVLFTALVIYCKALKDQIVFFTGCISCSKFAFICGVGGASDTVGTVGYRVAFATFFNYFSEGL